MAKQPEEVPLSGGTPKKPEKTQKPENDATDFEQSNVSEALAESIRGVTDDAQIVDKIIQAPTEHILPWEDVELPSKGLYYDWPNGVIQVHPWGASVDKILATSRLAQTGQSINYLINSCCRFPGGFNPEDLLVGDQVFLLYYLRGITYGNIYEFIITCPNPQCQATSTHTADLNELAQTITWADESLGGEPFKVSLPFLSKTAGRDINVGIRFLRVRDSQIIARNRRTLSRAVGGSSRAKIVQRQRRKKEWVPGDPVGGQQEHEETFSQDIPLDDTLTKNIEMVIVDVMGVQDRFKVRQFVEKLHSSDLATVREWLTDNTPGIMTQVEIGCPECGNEFRVMLPITEGFFRPENN